MGITSCEKQLRDQNCECLHCLWFRCLTKRKSFESVLHYYGDKKYLFVNGKEIFKLKANNKIVNFPTQFCLENRSNGFGATNSTKVYLKRNVYDFSVDCNTIEKSDTLYIYKYLMVKNNIE